MTNITLSGLNLPLKAPPAKAFAHETALYVTPGAHGHFPDLTDVEASPANPQKIKN